MVNPLDFIPKLSGFSPMPLGIMAPFMGYQSAALAYNFGLNYEFGKRVIKSMSNEKFNKIAEDPILLNELTSRHHDVLLKAFIHEVPKVDKIQDLIIKKMVELEFAKIKVMPELIAQIPKGFIEGIFNIGNTGETPSSTTPPTTTPPRGTPKAPPVTAKPTLQNFSKLPGTTQSEILALMKSISSRDKVYKSKVSRAVSSSMLAAIKIDVGKWKNLFRKVGGYTNPDPENAMPWLDPVVRAFLRDWYMII